MKTKKSLSKILAVSLAAACFVSTATPIALAAEQTIEVSTAGETAEVPLKVKLAPENKIFSATVAADIPMEQQADGTVVVASGAKIQNNNPYRSIKVSKLEVNTAADWELMPFGTDMTQHTGERAVALQLSSADPNKITQIDATGEVAIDESDWTIGKDGSKPINLNVKMPTGIASANTADAADTSEQFGTLSFTLDWADSDPGTPDVPTKYTVTVQPGEHGTTIKNFQVEANGNLTLPDTTPDLGYRLEKWIDYQTKATVTNGTKVTGDMTIQPVFVADTVTVTFKAGPYGTLKGTTSVQVQIGQPAAAFPTPSPASGYLFDKWVDQDGNTVTPATLITQTMTITAQFKEDASDPAWFNIDSNGDITGLSNTYLNLASKPTALKIPSTVNGKTVNGIAKGAFATNSYIQSMDVDLAGVSLNSDALEAAKQALTSISLPATATHIDVYAFAGCKQLSSVDLKNVSRLGKGAFMDCRTLMQIDLRNVTSIGMSCFNSCFLLSDIDLSSCSSLGEYAFASCSALKDADKAKINAINPAALTNP